MAQTEPEGILLSKITGGRVGARAPIGATIAIGGLAIVGWEVNEHVLPVLLADPIALSLIGVSAALAGLLIALGVRR